MVRWFCLISWRLFDIWPPYFGIMSQYDPMFVLKINVGHWDLYFMVQWFCLISWRLFDVWTPLFGIISWYDPKFDLKWKVGHYDLYFVVQWFCRIAWRLFDISTPYFGPIFHGPVILPYILKTIWYMNSILRDYGSVWPNVWPKNKCRSLLPVFHGPVFLPYILRQFDI